MANTLSYTALNRATFKLSGPDTTRYLSGQITQDVNLASEEQALATCITNAKGKLEGVAYIRAKDGSILIDAPAELRDSLFLRLDKYIIADDVTLEDVTDQYNWYHVLGPSEIDATWKCNRFGTSGYDTLTEPDGELISSEKIEHTRISNKVPTWGAELSENILPPEALLEKSSISYNKGCYIGQEVISRIRSAGKINQRLTSFKLNKIVQLPYTIPNPADSDAKPAGIITSCVACGEGFIALGYLKKKWFEETKFDIGDLSISVEHPPFT